MEDVEDLDGEMVQVVDAIMQTREWPDEPKEWPGPEEEDDGGDTVWWSVEQCPLWEQCSSGAWSKVAKTSRVSEAKLRSNVAEHLRVSGKHQYKWRDAVVCESCVIQSYTEDAADREKQRRDNTEDDEHAF